MILLNPRLKQRGKRYGTTDFQFSVRYSDDYRTAIMCDHNGRMLTFDIPYMTFWSNILNTPSNSTSHYDKMSVKKSLTIVKIFLPDSTIIYVKQ